MSNTPNISRNDFDPSKMYLYGTWQVAANLHDWDVNDKELMKVWFDSNYRNNQSGAGRWTKWSFTGRGNTVADNNILCSGGAAIVGGLYIQHSSNFQYYDESLTAVNYIIKGKLSTKTEVVAGASYKFTDSSKLLSAAYGLAGCRVYFDRVGATYDVVSLSGQQIVCSGDMSTVLADDEYIILPPEISALEGDAFGVDFELVVWLEDTDEIEDDSLIDPITGETPSHRSKVRWCIYKGYASSGFGGLGVGLPVDPNARPGFFPAGEFTDVTNSHYYLRVFTVKLDDNTTVVGDSAIPFTDDFFSEGEYFESAIDLTTRSLANETASGTNTTDIAAIVSAEKYLQAEDFVIGSEVGDDIGLYFTNAYDGADTEVDISASRVTTKYLKDQTVDPFILDTTSVSNDVPGDTALGEVYYKLDLKVTYDGPELAPNTVGGGLLCVAGTTSLNQEDLAVVAIKTDGTKNVQRMMPLGYQVEKQGLDWMIYDNTGTTELKIYPGTIKLGGILFQSVGTITIADVDNAANHVGGVPVDGWTYMYAVPTGAGERSLNIVFDETKPKWNGEYAPSVGYCLGMVYFASSTGVYCFRRGRRVYIQGTIAAAAITGDQLTAADHAIQPPTGATAIGFAVYANATPDTSSVYVNLLSTPTSGETVNRIISGVGDYRDTVEVAGSHGTYGIIVSDSDVAKTSLTTVSYEYLEITEGFFPDSARWDD